MEFLKQTGENMSFETEIMRDVKGICENIKSTIMTNIVKTVRKGDLTIEDSKLPGLDRIIRDATDQAFSNSARTLSETLKKYSEHLNK